MSDKPTPPDTSAAAWEQHAEDMAHELKQKVADVLDGKGATVITGLRRKEM